MRPGKVTTGVEQDGVDTEGGGGTKNVQLGLGLPKIGKSGSGSGE